MAGRNLYRKGVHNSRYASNTTLNEEFKKNIRSKVCELLSAQIEDQDLDYLLKAMCIASIGNENRCKSKEHATKKDMIAQLNAMKKLTDDNELFLALRNCDSRTFEKISQAQTNIISEILWEKGYFVDIEGCEFKAAPCIELPKPETSPIYLPMGVAGIRKAVGQAYIECNKWLDKAGNKNTPHLNQLANECGALWLKYKPNENPDAWRSDDGAHSANVSFAKAVFGMIQIVLGDSRLVELWNGNKKKA